MWVARGATCARIVGGDGWGWVGGGGGVPTIAMLSSIPQGPALLAQRLGSAVRVRGSHLAGAFPRVVADGPVDVIVSDLNDLAGSSVLPFLPSIHAEVPAVPILLSFEPMRLGLHDWQAVLDTGVRPELTVRASEPLSVAIHGLLRNPSRRSATETLLRHTVFAAPQTVRAYVAACAIEEVARLPVGRATQISGVLLRTVERRLQHARLPTASVLLRSLLALHAAWWLDRYHMPVKEVVVRLGLGDPSGLTRLLQRYGGATPTSLDETGGFDGMLRRFEASMRPSQPDAEANRQAR